MPGLTGGGGQGGGGLSTGGASMIGAGIGALGGLASSLVGNAANAKEAHIARQWAERMRNSNYQATVSDMRKAGLNPMMMYGGGSGGASSAQNVAAPKMSFDAAAQGLNKGISSALEGRRLKKDIDLANAQVKILKEHGKQEADKTKTQKIVNDYTRTKTKFDKPLIPVDALGNRMKGQSWITGAGMGAVSAYQSFKDSYKGNKKNPKSKLKKNKQRKKGMPPSARSE